MTELNQKTLRGILARILSVDESFIVPKQGNWFNPQEIDNAPDTWCAYVIRSNDPLTVPFYFENADKNTNSAATQKIATIDLQFVGENAEEIAQSVAFWSLREDVQREFAKVRGALMYGGMQAQSSPFFQDGLNTVFAWNVTIRVAWYHVIDTAQKRMPPILTGGNIRNL